MSGNIYQEESYTAKKGGLDTVGKMILAITLTIAILFVGIGAVICFVDYNNETDDDDSKIVFSLGQEKSISTTSGEYFSGTFTAKSSGTYTITVSGAILYKVYQDGSTCTFNTSSSSSYTKTYKIWMDKGEKYVLKFNATFYTAKVTISR